MAKGCLIVVGVLISVPLIFVLWLVLFPEEPATREKKLEILNQKLDNAESIQIYTELIDSLNDHKAELLYSISLKDTSDCVDFELTLPSDKGRQLSKYLTKQCERILSKSKEFSYATVMVCRNKSITLKLFQKDHDNYLYIHRSFYINDSLKRNIKLDNCRGRLIDGKYFYFVSIEDAFNYMDPNNFAPN